MSSDSFSTKVQSMMESKEMENKVKDVLEEIRKDPQRGMQKILRDKDVSNFFKRILSNIGKFLFVNKGSCDFVCFSHSTEMVGFERIYRQARPSNFFAFSPALIKCIMLMQRLTSIRLC